MVYSSENGHPISFLPVFVLMLTRITQVITHDEICFPMVNIEKELIDVDNNCPKTVPLAVPHYS